MPRWLHRTDKTLLISVPQSELSQPLINYVEEPNLSSVIGFPSKYWIITGNVVTLMTPAERTVVDLAERRLQRDIVTAELDGMENLIRAFMLIVLDEFNSHSIKINAILDAIDGANNLTQIKSGIVAIRDLPARTTAQLRLAIRNKLGS